MELLACLKPFGGVGILTLTEVQRYVYLIQAFGVDLGYTFRWSDWRGPFCDELAKIAVNAVKSPYNGDAKLDEQTRSRIEACQAWIADTRPSSVSIITWLDVLVWIHYLLHVLPRRDREGLTKEQVFRDLVDRVPVMKRDKSLFEAGWKALDRVGLIKNPIVPRHNAWEGQEIMNEGSATCNQEGTQAFRAYFHVRVEARDSRTAYFLNRKLELPFVPHPGLIIKSGDYPKFIVKSVEWDTTRNLFEVWLDDVYVDNIDRLNETVQYLREIGWL